MAPKRLWIMQQGEQLPFDPGPPRLLRSAILARELARRGNEVLFFNSTFNHQQKLHLAAASTLVDSGHGYQAMLLHGRGYKRNISLMRILSQRDTAAEFARLAPGLPKPDAILCCYPSIELAFAATRFASASGVPVAIDCRDMWPDIFADHLGLAARTAAWPLLAHYRRQRNAIMRAATAVTGITEAFVDWGLAAAGRPRRPLDRPFHLAIDPNRPPASEIEKATAFWEQRLGRRQPGNLTLAFGGTVSHRVDLATLVDAVKALPEQVKSSVTLVICGRGDGLASLEQRAAGEAHIIFGGWRSAAEMSALLARSDVGLLPYPNSRDFLISYPNKVGEYLSQGLIVMSSLEGISKELLATTGTGEFYRYGDVADAGQAILKLLAGKESRAARRQAALAAYEANFEPSRIYGEFSAYVENLAGAAG